MTVERFTPEVWPSVVFGLSENNYHSFDAMSASRLRTLDKSTSLHLAHSLVTPMEGPALVVGRALHSKVLTPASYLSDFAIAPPCDRRTTAGKAKWDSFVLSAAAKTVLSGDQSEEVDAMHRSIMKHPDAKMIIADLSGQSEVSLFAEVAGIKAKARFDRLVEANGERIIVDVKTTASSASKSEFEKTIWNFGYGIQSAFYLDMAARCGVPAQHFVFVVVEKTEPYAVAVYRFSDEIAQAFRPRMLELISEYKEFKESGPKGYEGVTEIGIPAWAANRMTTPELGRVL